MKTEIKLTSTGSNTYACGRFTITNIGAGGTGHGRNLWSVTATDSKYTWNFNTLKQVRQFIANKTEQPNKKAQTRKAFDRLHRLGFPVFKPEGTITVATAEFYLSAELPGPNDMPCCFYDLDMYRDAEMPGVDPKVTDILNAAGLFAEWLNPGRLNIYLS